MIAKADNVEIKEIKLSDRPKYTKKDLVADLPTWCPGCGDFSVLSIYFKMMERLQVPHEKITSIAGIGCSSRFPYFVNAYGVHFLHGRARLRLSAYSSWGSAHVSGRRRRFANHPGHH